MVAGLAVGMGGLIVCGAYADWRSRENELRALRARLAAMKAETAPSSLLVTRVGETERWWKERVSFLECLREITLAFPSNERIWTTSITVKEDMRGVVSGKASDPGAVIALIDSLRRNPVFKDVKLVHMREAGGERREITYTVSFLCVPGGRTGNETGDRST